MHTQPCSRRAGADGSPEPAFALIDLVAALAMIALIAGVLVWPALAKANDHGTRTVCMNNLRQMGAALTLYANENRDYLAYPNWGSVYTGWLYAPVYGAPPSLRTGAYATNQVGAYKTGLWYPYVKSPAAYLCPADLDSRYYAARDNQLSTYVMNGAVCGYGTSSSSLVCKITDPWSTEGYLLWEPDENRGLGPLVYNDASSFPDRNEGMGRLHLVNGGQILTLAGAVQFVSSQKFTTEQNASSKSLAWWSPFSSNGH